MVVMMIGKLVAKDLAFFSVFTAFFRGAFGKALSAALRGSVTLRVIQPWRNPCAVRMVNTAPTRHDQQMITILVHRQLVVMMADYPQDPAAFPSFIVVSWLAIGVNSQLSQQNESVAYSGV